LPVLRSRSASPRPGSARCAACPRLWPPAGAFPMRLPEPALSRRSQGPAVQPPSVPDPDPAAAMTFLTAPAPSPPTAPSPPSPIVPRWVRTAAYAIPLLVLPSAAWRLSYILDVWISGPRAVRHDKRRRGDLHREPVRRVDGVRPAHDRSRAAVGRGRPALGPARRRAAGPRDGGDDRGRRCSCGRRCSTPSPSGTTGGGPPRAERRGSVAAQAPPRSSDPSTGMAADSSGDAVRGSSWSQTNRKSMTPVSIEAWMPSTL
jgi:hypothetical protein